MANLKPLRIPEYASSPFGACLTEVVGAHGVSGSDYAMLKAAGAGKVSKGLAALLVTYGPQLRALAELIRWRASLTVAEGALATERRRRAGSPAAMDLDMPPGSRQLLAWIAECDPRHAYRGDRAPVADAVTILCLMHRLQTDPHDWHQPFVGLLPPVGQSSYESRVAWREIMQCRDALESWGDPVREDQLELFPMGDSGNT